MNVDFFDTIWLMDKFIFINQLVIKMQINNCLCV